MKSEYTKDETFLYIQKRAVDAYMEWERLRDIIIEYYPPKEGCYWDIAGGGISEKKLVQRLIPQVEDNT